MWKGCMCPHTRRGARRFVSASVKIFYTGMLLGYTTVVSAKPLWVRCPGNGHLVQLIEHRPGGNAVSFEYA